MKSQCTKPGTCVPSRLHTLMIIPTLIVFKTSIEAVDDTSPKDDTKRGGGIKQHRATPIHKPFM